MTRDQLSSHLDDVRRTPFVGSGQGAAIAWGLAYLGDSLVKAAQIMKDRR